MDEKTKLLEQLRIDRGEGTRSVPDPRPFGSDMGGLPP